jgi:polygalacturonase
VTIAAAALALLSAGSGPAFDVRAYGAKGDGVAIDSPAINAAIDAASAAGGGTVVLPAGTYLSFSIRLRSRITLVIGAGATLVAADPADGRGRYDTPEPNEWDAYQDFGHSHWQNSLVWGIGVEDVAILGPGRIDGKGLTRRGPGAAASREAGRPAGDARRRARRGAGARGAGREAAAAAARGRVRGDGGPGQQGDRAQDARRVTIRDLTIFRAGHFAILPTGVDDFTIDNVRIDTQRDGINLDACRNVRVSNVAINAPNDDALVLKSSYALGVARPTENVTITNSVFSGYDLGTMLDGTYGTTMALAPDRDGPNGRIKLGTESNGGFRNVTISNVTFVRSRGIALETVDGGALEDVTIANVVMRDVTTAPIFIRLGRRGRGPGPPPVATVRRIKIAGLIATGVDPRFPILLAGLAGHPVEDVELRDIRVQYRGGGTAAQAAREPDEMEDAYPEPSMFGVLPRTACSRGTCAACACATCPCRSTRPRRVRRSRCATSRAPRSTRSSRSRRRASPPGRCATCAPSTRSGARRRSTDARPGSRPLRSRLGRGGSRPKKWRLSRMKSRAPSALALLLVAGAWQAAPALAADDARQVCQVPGHGAVGLEVPRGWRAACKPLEKPPSASLAFQSEPASFQLTVTVVWLQPSQRGGLEDAALRSHLQDVAAQSLPRAVERAAVLEAFRGPEASGYVFTLTDKAPGPGSSST